MPHAIMDDEEIAAIRDWVRAGGTLYARGASSLLRKNGLRQNVFMLAAAPAVDTVLVGGGA